MIEKIANNESNQEELNLQPIESIIEKLNYYRSLFGKVQDLSDEEFEILKKDIATFFNLKIGGNTQDAPKRLVRISINNKILAAQGKELSYLTEISQLLAPRLNGVALADVIFQSNKCCTVRQARPVHIGKSSRSMAM